MTGATIPILRRFPVELVAPNKPAKPPAVLVELVKPVMTWPRPSNCPVNGRALVPIGVKPLVPQTDVFDVSRASIFAPSTKLPFSAPVRPCKSVALVLPAAPRLLITV